MTKRNATTTNTKRNAKRDATSKNVVVETTTTTNDDATSSPNYSYVATQCRKFGLNPKCVRATLRRHVSSHVKHTRWNVANDEIDRVIALCVARANARKTNA